MESGAAPVDPLSETDTRVLASITGPTAALPLMIPAPGPGSAPAASPPPVSPPPAGAEASPTPPPLDLPQASEYMQDRPGDLLRFTLYETRHHYYLVSHGARQTQCQILTIDRTPPIARQSREPAVAPSATSHAVAHAPSPSEASASPGSDHDAGSDHSVDMGPAADDAMEQGPSRAATSTLTSEITQLASSLVPVDEGRAAAPKPAAPHGHSAPAEADAPPKPKYLGLYDTEIQRMTTLPEWKSYMGDVADAPRDAATADGPERTVPPIAALGAPRSPKQGPRAPPRPPPQPAAPTRLDPADDAAWALNVSSSSKQRTPAQLQDWLAARQEAARGSGGLKEVGRFFGLVGFVRFTAGYYMVLISKRSVVSLLGGHYIYHCDETQVVPVCHASMQSMILPRSKTRDQREATLLHTFRQVDLSKNFYFSYTYDLTRTLQDNMTGSRCPAAADAWGYREKFMWNYRLLRPAFADCQGAPNAPPGPGDKRVWVLPLVHGFVDQAKLSVLSQVIYVCLIARRSRHFAGARFYRRGIAPDGHVANDVETEQIVSKPLSSAFYAPPAQHTSTKRASPHYTSYVMMRGSIPIYWTQDSTNMSPRPPIAISLVDPYFEAAARHFQELFSVYGAPVLVLNLVKGTERQPRESKLRDAYDECVKYLNQFLPAEPDRRIRYIAWDMSHASKSRTEDVIGFLEELAKNLLSQTSFFHSGPTPPAWAASDAHAAPLSVQHGIVRMNCVDCLDRTNAAQFVLGKTAFAHQLHALGLLKYPHLAFDSHPVNMLTEMYHDLGDTIALQYGGSALAHTTDTYRKINHWTSHSRDTLEGIRRYYANSFADAEKQASIDLFLGQTPADAIVVPPAMPLRALSFHVEDDMTAQADLDARAQRLIRFANADTGFWDNYYRPTLFTDLQRHHAYKMTAVHLALTAPDGALPMLNDQDAPRKMRPRTRRRRTTASFATMSPSSSFHMSLIGGVRRWISSTPDKARRQPGSSLASSVAEASADPAPNTAAAPVDSAPHSLEAIVQRSLAPAIAKNETREYQVYCSQFAHVQFRHGGRAAEADVRVYEGAVALGHGALDRLGNAQLRTDSTAGGAPDAAYASFVGFLAQPRGFLAPGKVAS